MIELELLFYRLQKNVVMLSNVTTECYGTEMTGVNVLNVTVTNHVTVTNVQLVSLHLYTK